MHPCLDKNTNARTLNIQDVKRFNFQTLFYGTSLFKI